MAATMVRERSTGTMSSLSPWKTQMGMDLSTSAFLASPPPQSGTEAAKTCEYCAAMRQAPEPPMELPGEIDASFIDRQVLGEISDERDEIGRDLVLPADVGGGALRARA
jgi:hypothetical protein